MPANLNDEQQEKDQKLSREISELQRGVPRLELELATATAELGAKQGELEAIRASK